MGGSGGKFESVDVVCCEALPVEEAENLVQEESKPVPNLELLLLQQMLLSVEILGLYFQP